MPPTWLPTEPFDSLPSLPLSYRHALLEAFETVAHRPPPKRQAASRYLKRMSSIGVLEERSFGREKLFVNTKLLELLTAEP